MYIECMCLAIIEAEKKHSLLLQRIPAGFSHFMEGRTSGLVSLTGPSGNTWHAQLAKEGNDLFLHHGWLTFLEDHVIEVGDLLVFRYDGHLRFTVLVFDHRACEKESAFISKCSENSCDPDHSNIHKRNREENCSLNVVPEGFLKKMKGSAFENQELKTDIGSKDLSLLEWVRPIRTFREKGESSKEEAQLRCPASDAAVSSQMEYRNGCEGKAVNLINHILSLINKVSISIYLSKLNLTVVIKAYLSQKPFLSPNICLFIILVGS